MLTDPISDMLTRVRNASAAGNPEVVLPFSRIKYEIMKIMESAGYFEKVEKRTKGKAEIRAILKYTDNGVAIRHIARVSKPGRRVYMPYTKLPRVLNDLGIAIVSTSAGVMSGKEARKRHLGGEVICEVY